MEHELLDTHLSAISHVASLLQFFQAMHDIAFSKIRFFFGHKINSRASSVMFFTSKLRLEVRRR